MHHKCNTEEFEKKEKVKISRIWRNEKKRKGKKEGNIIYLFVVQF